LRQAAADLPADTFAGLGMLAEFYEHGLEHAGASKNEVEISFTWLCAHEAIECQFLL